MVKREEYSFRKKMIIEIREHHDGNYGAPGKTRKKKKKPTKEQMRLMNAQNKAMKCRHRLLEYFTPGDCFGTWTYAMGNRPPDMAAAGSAYETSCSPLQSGAYGNVYGKPAALKEINVCRTFNMKMWIKR